MDKSTHTVLLQRLGEIEARSDVLLNNVNGNLDKPFTVREAEGLYQEIFSSLESLESALSINLLDGLPSLPLEEAAEGDVGMHTDPRAPSSEVSTPGGSLQPGKSLLSPTLHATPEEFTFRVPDNIQSTIEWHQQGAQRELRDLDGRKGDIYSSTVAVKKELL